MNERRTAITGNSMIIGELHEDLLYINTQAGLVCRVSMLTPVAQRVLLFDEFFCDKAVRPEKNLRSHGDYGLFKSGNQRRYPSGAKL